MLNLCSNVLIRIWSYVFCWKYWNHKPKVLKPKMYLVLSGSNKGVGVPVGYNDEWSNSLPVSPSSSVVLFRSMSTLKSSYKSSEIRISMEIIDKKLFHGNKGCFEVVMIMDVFELCWNNQIAQKFDLNIMEICFINLHKINDQTCSISFKISHRKNL